MTDHILRILGGLWLFCCMQCVSAVALDMENQSGERRNDAAEMQRVGLTLEACVNQAYAYNITLQGSRQALQATGAGVGEAWGQFDPEFFTMLFGSENIQPSSSVLDAGARVAIYDEDRFSMSTGLRGQLLSGASYTLDVSLNRTYNPDSVYLISNPLVSNNVGIELRQPLLRGGWTATGRSDLIQARLNTQAESLNLETTLNEVLFSTIEAYWNLVFAHEDLRAKEKSLELANDLLYINTRKKEEGVFSKMEVLEAEVEVALKKEQLITARNSVLAAEDALKLLIYPFEGAGAESWNVKITPLTEAQEALEIDLDVAALTDESLQNRPDFRQRSIDLKNMEIELGKARNALLPTLDMTGAWRFNALGSNYGNSFDDIEKRNYRYFSVGLEFAYPLGNRSARYALKRVEVEMQRALTAMKDLEIQIAHEVRDVVRELGLQYEKLNASRESWRLSKERYEGEKKRLEAGISISYQVREAERNLLTETVNKARALLDYQIALARLSKVRGVLLTEYGIPVPTWEAMDVAWF